jgi:uncharacterized protein (TIGR02246 family)
MRLHLRITDQRAGSTFRVRGIIVAILMLTSCASARPPDALERDPLGQRQAEFFAAMADRDATALAALFADDAVVHVAGMPPVEGRESIRQFYQNLFRFLESSRAAPGRAEVSAARDIAWTHGRVVNVFGGAQGPTEYAGKYVVVWRRQALDWQVALYAVSNNQSEARR